MVRGSPRKTFSLILTAAKPQASNLTKRGRRRLDIPAHARLHLLHVLAINNRWPFDHETNCSPSSHMLRLASELWNILNDFLPLEIAWRWLLILNMRAKTTERNLHISLWKLITRQTDNPTLSTATHLLRWDASYFRGPAPLYPNIRWGRTSYI